MANDNIFSTVMNGAGDWFAKKLASYMQDAIGREGNILARYYSGDQRPALEVKYDKKTGKYIDDNIMQNFVGLAIDRSVSRLYQGGVDFEPPKLTTPTKDENGMMVEVSSMQDKYLDRVWDLNKKEILLYQVGLFGAVHGTCYIKIRPNAKRDPYSGKLFPALVAINPRSIRIKTDAEDMDDVEQYKIEYTCHEERDGRNVEVTHTEITKHAKPEQGEMVEGEQPDTWVIEHYEKVGNMQTVLIDSIAWEYDFPPIIHWKNLPSLESCYGSSEVDDVINVQDKSNFVVSNTAKIIKFHAHPQTIITGSSAKSAEPVDTSASTMLAFPNADTKAYNLEMQSDLVSSREFANDLRQSIMDTAREVDPASITSRLGALTNFGIRVIYSDALQKNDTKRQLYGDAFLELNRRLLVLAGWTGEASNPGSVSWGDPLPTNIMEDAQADKIILEMGLVDKETLYSRYENRYGVDWETVQANLIKEQEAANATNANIGATILRNFGQGIGTPQTNETIKAPNL